MLYFRKELNNDKYSTYQLNKAIKNKQLFKVANGLYSNKEFVNPLEIICKKYPNAIFTLQVFMPNDLFEFGKTQIEIENVKVNIYNKERMLIELIRKKNLIPFDYYKEIITNYRNEADILDIYKMQKYISYYKNESSLYDTLMREVF